MKRRNKNVVFNQRTGSSNQVMLEKKTIPLEDSTGNSYLPQALPRDCSLIAPDGPIVRAIDADGILETKPEDLVKTGYDIFGLQSDVPASAIIVMCLLWQPESIRDILANPSIKRMFKNMVTVKDVLGLANYLPPSFISKIIAVFSKRGFRGVK